MGRRPPVLFAVLAVAAAAAGVAAAGDEGDDRAPFAPDRGAAAPATAPAEAAPAPAEAGSAEAEPAPPVLMLVRRRGGLPDRWIARLRRADAVDALAEASRAQWLVRRAVTAAGRVADAPPDGYAIPLDVLVVDPRAYARVTPLADRAAVRRLRGGRALLSRTSARLRGLGEGARMRLADGRVVRVAGVVDDETARDAEVVASGADVPSADRRGRQVLVATRDPRAVDALVPDGPRTRVGVLVGGGPSRRGGIVRTVHVKERFGEFAVRLPYGEDWIEIDPSWIRRTIVTRDVPLLGSVTCHRELIGPLRRALGSLERRGLARLVDPGDYAGCHAPRRIPGSGTLSLHAWGLAVDVNASRNPQGAEPTQDPRVVAAFERAGFTWGGRWPTAPDGMHFELQG